MGTSDEATIRFVLSTHDSLRLILSVMKKFDFVPEQAV